MLAAAKRPTLYVGVGLRRHGLTELVVRLAEHLRLPLATDVLGKAAIPESHPQNSSYGMLEAIDRPRNYYLAGAGTMRPWPARVLGRRVRPRPSWEPWPVPKPTRAFLIEAVTARDDLSPVMARIRAHLHTPPKPRSL